MSQYDDILLKLRPQDVYGLTDEMIAAQYPMLPSHARPVDTKKIFGNKKPVSATKGKYSKEDTNLGVIDPAPNSTMDPGKEAIRLGTDIGGMIPKSLHTGAIGLEGVGEFLNQFAKTGDIDTALQASSDFIQTSRQNQKFPWEDKQSLPFELLGKEVIEPAMEVGEKATGDTGFIRAAADFTMQAAPLLGLPKMVKGVEHLNTNLGERGSIGNPFYSEAERAVDKIPWEEIPARKIPQLLQQNKVKPEEIKALGLDRIAKEELGRKFTKAELKQHIQDNGIKLGEDVYGGKKEVIKTPTALQHIENGGTIRSELTGATYGPEDILRFKADVLNKEIGPAGFIEFDKIPKDPQYEQYKSIKSTDGVVPGSYTEEFVTAEGLGSKEYLDWENYQKTLENKYGEDWKFGKANEAESLQLERLRQEALKSSRGWTDPHSSYSETQNPLGRFRYDIKQHPDGRKTMRIQEVQEGFGKGDAPNIPEHFRNNVMSANKDITTPLYKGNRNWRDVVVKKAVARAKELGLDGIEWSTGEQQRDLYNSALRQVADEARYNPETRELFILKNGQNVKTYPQKVPVEKIEEHIGKDAAKRLMESKIGTENPDWMQDIDGWKLLGTDWRIDDIPDGTGYYVLNKGKGQIGFNTLEKAKQYIQEKSNKFHNYHRLTDLSMDAQWPGKLYGDFEKIEREPLKLNWEKATEDAGFDDYEIKAGAEYVIHGDKSYNIIQDPSDYTWYVIDQDGQNVAANFPTNLKAKEHIENMLGTSKNAGMGDFNFNAAVPKLLKKYGKGEFELSNSKEVLDKNQQPVMWFTKDTPTEFPIYEGVTGIFNMLQDEIKKEGGGAKGFGKVAVKYGVPAGALAYWLKADDEKKKKLLALPAMAGIMKIFGKKGEVPENVSKSGMSDNI